MSYPPRHETTNLRASDLGRRARVPGGRLALVGCFSPPTLPNTSRQRPGRERLPDRPQPQVQPADRPQRHPHLQRRRSSGGVEQGLLQATHHSRGLRLRGRRATQGGASSGPSALWQREQPVDLADGRRGELGGRAYHREGEWRNHPGYSGADGSSLAESQALDHFPRPPVREKKGGATG